MLCELFSRNLQTPALKPILILQNLWKSNIMSSRKTGICLIVQYTELNCHLFM